MPLARHLISGCLRILFVIRHLLADFAPQATLLCRSQGALAAENLFLRKQLALFQERKVKPHRATGAARFLMALVDRFFDWPSQPAMETSNSRNRSKVRRIGTG